MDAKEARGISDKKQLDLDQIIDLIKKTAEDGCTQINIFNPAPSAIVELMRLKYKITINTDVYNGMESHLCSW